MERAEPMVVNNPTARRFEIHAEGQIAFLEYTVSDGYIRLLHTAVPPELEGRGYASHLARAGLEYARSEHLRVVPLCPFVSAYLRRHPEYAPLVFDPLHSA